MAYKTDQGLGAAPTIDKDTWTNVVTQALTKPHVLAKIWANALADRSHEVVRRQARLPAAGNSSVTLR